MPKLKGEILLITFSSELSTLLQHVETFIATCQKDKINTLKRQISQVSGIVGSVEF
jgi:hypothetical protein